MSLCDLTEKLIMKILILFLFLLPIMANSKSNVSGRVVLLRGKVYVKNNSTVTKLKKGNEIQEGSVIKTLKKSFIKVIFIDKSTVNIGPNSTLKIESFKTKKPGILNLIKGQIRSKVTKNYMDMSKGKSKLFIKTKSAAMGVRGTDFNVSYNPSNNNTSLITFSGAVAMARLDSSSSNRHLSHRMLEKRVSSNTAVMVKRGEFSHVSSKSETASKPIKISPKQIKALKRNNLSNMDKKEKKHHKTVRNLVPKGLEDSKEFITSSATETILEKNTSKKEREKVEKKILKIKATETAAFTNNHESNVVSSSDNVRKAGGVVDIATGTYIAPPAGSTFDANQGIYVINPTIATVDQNGNFRSDIIKIDNNGLVTAVANTNKRLPASAGMKLKNIVADVITNAQIDNGSITTGGINNTCSTCVAFIPKVLSPNLRLDNYSTNATFIFTAQ